MQAARLVEYSDSEEDEERQWREFRKQRSTLRMPSSSVLGAAAAAATARNATSTAATETSPPVPASSTGDRQHQQQQQQPHPQSDSTSSSADRDYAFTPRKRSVFLRSSRMDSSCPPSAHNAPSSSSPPATPMSPDVDFSFAYSPSPPSSTSPMSDGGEASSQQFAWSQVESLSQSQSQSQSQPQYQQQQQNKPSEGPTVDTYSPTGASSGVPRFTFGASKATPQQQSASAASSSSSTSVFQSAKADTSGVSPFKFDAFFKTVEEKAPTTASPFAQAPPPTAAPSVFPEAKTTKTPQRQKDIHRAAKRRVSGGGVSGVAGLSGFGGTPEQSPPTASPFSFGVPGSSTPTRKVLSPMDIEMDEQSHAPPVAPPVFAFGLQTPPQASKRSTSFVFGSATRQNGSDAGRRSASSSRVKTGGTRNGTAPPTASQSESIPQTKTSETTFLFGFKSGSSSPFSSSSSFSAAASSSTASAFGATTTAPKSTTDPAPPPPRKSSSFTFEAAFKEYQAAAKEEPTPVARVQSQPHAASGGTQSTHGQDGGNESPFSTGYQSLAARLERRRRARETPPTASIPESTSATSDHAAPQQSPFGSANRADPFGGHAPARANVRYSFGGSTSSTTPSFVFGEPKPDAKRRTTNVFQKPTSTGASTTAAPAPASNPWGFDAPVFEKEIKKEPVFNGVQFNQGGVFSFNRHPGVSASTQPEPSQPQPPPPPPPVENLKSNFDGFSIGANGKTGSKSVKTRAGPRKQAASSSSTASTKATAPPKTQSPFSMPTPTSAFSATTQPRSSVFDGTPPAADPFVTPIFGQKKKPKAKAPKAKQGLNARFSDANRSPFAPGFQQATTNSGGFGDGEERDQKKTSPSKASGFGAPAATENGFPMGNSPGAAFFTQRRVVRPGRFFGQPQQRQSTPAAASNAAAGDDDTHRKWSDWKLLGGEAYSNRNYQESADCYLNSTNALETLLTDQPELKTDQLMKDKAKLHSNRAAALMMLLHMSDAQRECYLSIESDPAYTRAYLRLGRIQIMMGDADGAKESVKTIKQLLSLDDGSRNWRDSNDLAGVKKIELGVESLERLRGEIKWCLDVHDHTNALSHLNEALAIAPSSRLLQTQKAQVLFDQKNYSEVAEYCVGIIRKQKTGRGSPSRAAAAAAATQQQQQAADKKSDNDVSLLGIELSLLRIRALHYENKTDEAAFHMHKLELAAPTSEKVIQLKRLLHDMKDLKHQANDNFKKGAYGKAQQLYTQALALDPTHDEYCAVLYCNRAAALMGLQQYESAIHDCNAALRRKTRYPRSLLRRARCNVALKRYAAAIADFDRYLKDLEPSEASTSPEIELEKQTAQQAMDYEAQERKRKEEQQKKERQRGGNSRAKQQQQHQQQQQQQQRRRQNGSAWDDTKYYEEFWRSSSTGGGASSSQSSHAGGARGSSRPAATHSKHQRTHYEVLGLVKTATQEEIKKAYRKLALLHHPDKAKDTVHADLFKDMTAAYNVLSDTTARLKYDRELQFASYGRYYEC